MTDGAPDRKVRAEHDSLQRNVGSHVPHRRQRGVGPRSRGRSGAGDGALAAMFGGTQVRFDIGGSAMKRPTQYSRSPASAHAAASAPPAAAAPSRPPAAAPMPATQAPALGSAVGKPASRIGPRTERALLLLGGALVVALLWGVQQRGGAPRQFTQADIDKAVLHTLATKDLPSQQARAAGGNEHGVDHQRGRVPFGPGCDDRGDDRSAVKHARLDRGGAQFGKHRFDLGAHQGGRGRLNRPNLARILGGQAGDGTGAMDPERSERLEVRLDPGAAARIGSGNGQCNRNAFAFRHGRQRTRCHGTAATDFGATTGARDAWRRSSRGREGGSIRALGARHRLTT